MPKKIQEIHNILTQKTASIRADKCVNIYFELDYDLYKEKGSVNAATNFISGIFNSVQTLYANDGINVAMSEAFVWTKNDGYGTSSTTNALTSFRSKRKNFNGDIAHLVSRGAPKNGGIAWVDGLCTSYNYAYSWINGSYKNFPTYSWTVNVITHETGHVLGSPHTHNCSWPGGAIDNCYSPEPSGGSTCSSGPSPSGGGTIMSYCHLTSYGINFNKGFGELPAKLIRNMISNAGCLSSCSGITETTPTCSDGVQNGNETGIDCGGDCTPCVTCDDGIKNGNETGIDCGGDCNPCAVDSYCESKGANSQYEHIAKVEFAGMTNNSAKEGYGNFTNKVANVEKGKTYKIKITPKYAGAAYAEH